MKKVYLAGLLVFALFLTGCDVYIGATDPIIRVSDRIGSYSSTSYPTYKVNISSLSRFIIYEYDGTQYIEQERFYIDLDSTGRDFEAKDSLGYKYTVQFDNDATKLILEIKNPSGNRVYPDGYSILRR